MAAAAALAIIVAFNQALDATKNYFSSTKFGPSVETFPQADPESAPPGFDPSDHMPSNEGFTPRDDKKPQILVNTPEGREYKPNPGFTSHETDFSDMIFENKDHGGDSKEWKKNPEKSESDVWKNLKPYKKDTKTNGLSGSKRKYYEWDHIHNDIEVYDSNKKHLGSMNPISGDIYKKPVPGRKLR